MTFTRVVCIYKGLRVCHAQQVFLLPVLYPMIYHREFRLSPKSAHRMSTLRPVRLQIIHSPKRPTVILDITLATESRREYRWLKLCHAAFTSCQTLFKQELLTAATVLVDLPLTDVSRILPTRQEIVSLHISVLVLKSLTS